MSETAAPQGFSAKAFDFYQELRADNSKTFWEAHKSEFETYVRRPMLALLADLEDEFGSAKLFRPNRDIRFSKDKSPYKDHQGAFVAVAESVGYYVQVNSESFMVAAGWYSSSPESIARYREAVASTHGEALEVLVGELVADGYDIGGDRMKTRPKGVAADHPRLELLKHRTLLVSREYPDVHALEGSAARDLVVEGWRDFRPLMGWFAANVS